MRIEARATRAQVGRHCLISHNSPSEVASRLTPAQVLDKAGSVRYQFGLPAVPALAPLIALALRNRDRDQFIVEQAALPRGGRALM